MKKIILLGFLVMISLGSLLLSDRVMAIESMSGGNQLSDCDREKISPDLWAVIEREVTQEIVFGGHSKQDTAIGNLEYYGFMLGFEPADLSHCLGLPTDEFRICRWEALTAHANIVQAEARAYLDSLEVPYDVFVSITLMYIDAEYGNRDLVCELSKMEDVKTIIGDLMGPDTYSQIYALDPTEPSVEILVCVLWDCYSESLPVAENAIITVPGIKGPSSFEDLQVGQEIFYTLSDDNIITRIFVIEDIPTE